MARGFESKDVEFQQSEAARRSRVANRPLTAEERDRLSRVRTLELALSRTETELGLAHSAAHRRMLEQAAAALRDQIRRAQT